MNLALARRSGQELSNSYTITGCPDFAPLRRFFRAVVNQLQLLYDDMPPVRSLLDSTRDEIYQSSVSSDDTLTWVSPVEELVDMESPVNLSPSLTTDKHRLCTSRLSGRSRQRTDAHVLSSRAAVPGMCIASTDLLSYIDPLPMDRLALHDARAVRDWPAASGLSSTIVNVRSDILFTQARECGILSGPST